MPGVVMFQFKPEHRVRFEAGQFIAITIPHANSDDRGDMREFSISSSPHEELLSITSSYVERDGSSYKKALLSLNPGDSISLGEPMGDFVLPKDISIPLVFVAAGIGSTPYASIVKWLVEKNERRTIQLVNSASQPNGFLFTELWKSYGLDFVPVITQKTSGWAGATGRLTPKRVLELANPYKDKLMYLAGPQSFIEPLFNDLLELGIPRYQLLLDYFPGY